MKRTTLNTLCFSLGLMISSTAFADAPKTDTKPAAAQKEQKLDQAKREVIKDAVVHVYVVKHSFSTLSPWNSNTRKGSGSGLIIEGGMILTNAHVSADATFIEVQRHGETKRYEAEVVFTSHEADLALLRTKEHGVYKDVKPLELGELPNTQQEVEVYGFPIGGNTLSVTRGVVSRIEKQNYAHTGENLIAVQVDAAINFGNSGGPVISNGKVVGVAMQSGFFTENIGYMIPTPILRHFLADIKDGKQDGFGFPGFIAQSMENPAMRRKYQMGEEQTGILVYKVFPDTPAVGKIEVGDIITHVDGNKIENNGSVEFRKGEFLDYTHYIDLHQLGEDVSFTVSRDGKATDIAIRLDKPGKEYLLVRPKEYDRQPTYFIYGGFVFMPLNQDVLDSLDPVPPALAALSREAPNKKRNEVVLMTKVLPSDINKDYHHAGNIMVEKVNGEKVTSFIDFFDRVQSSNGKFLQLESEDGFQIVIDRDEANNKQPSILMRYGITKDRSKDLIARANMDIAKDPKTQAAQKAPATPVKPTANADVQPKVNTI